MVNERHHRRVFAFSLPRHYTRSLRSARREAITKCYAACRRSGCRYLMATLVRDTREYRVALMPFILDTRFAAAAAIVAAAAFFATPGRRGVAFRPPLRHFSDAYATPPCRLSILPLADGQLVRLATLLMRVFIDTR